MNETERAVSGNLLEDEAAVELGLRPRCFAEYLGQQAEVDNLKVFVAAARKRGEPLDHVLISGPPGLGKTTLAHVIANELDVGLHTTSGPSLERAGDLAGLLTNLAEGDLLFIDEIHRCNPTVEENLYPAMEDFEFDIMLGSGPHARSYKMPLKRFTLVGATTRKGLLTGPLRDRFGIVIRLDFYDDETLHAIATRSAAILGIALQNDAAAEIARRSRGTPRIANRLLRRLRDFAEVEGDGTLDHAIAQSGLERLGIDAMGLDDFDRRLLATMIEKFGGGPVGLETMAAALSEDKGTIEDVIEPYLLKQGLIQRTPRGRTATVHAYSHLGLESLLGGRQQRLC